MPQASGLQFTARVGGLPSDLFSVVGFTLTERLSEVFYGHLELSSTDPSIQASEILEQPLDLVVWQDGEPLRRFTGVVNEFVRGDAGHRRTRYELNIQPPLWRLGMMHNSRMFQTQSTDTIVRTLLEERGIIDSVFDLKRTPEQREYCVQHRESDLAFLERLAAEEGWHYRYEHGSVDAETQPALVIADHHGDAPKLEPAEYNAKAGGSTKRPSVFRFRYEERVRVASVAMKDYTFRNPAYALMHEQASGDLKHREDYQHYDYPGRFKADASGQPFTEARLQSLRNDASTASGESNRPDFCAGAKVELKEHDSAALNREWLLTAVTHTGSQPQALEEEGGSDPTTYHNQFNAIPADLTWVPQTPHRPLMDGPQIAIVTGPEGETTYDPGTLEKEFETFRLVTTTPWREEPATFEGIMLRDLLERNGLRQATGIKVTAENDYEVTIPSEVFNEVPIMIATRLNGQPHHRRARGPLQFVIPMDVFEDLDLTERYWVWMAARIAPAE